ncbi:MAG: alpha-2-macroglobulin [Deltaproteobacteria bacterium]|nr:MAG: alpha-2-macroglobulin [Deltaproteobacteria bacterium]
MRKEAQKAYADGNWKAAFELYSMLCLEVTNDPKRVGGDLARVYQCLQRLNRINELDDFREKVISRHSKNWRLLLEAARIYSYNPHWGYMVAGKFERGYHRGGGKYMNAIQRDRVRALQLMTQAMPFAADDPARSEVANFYLEFAGMLLQYGGYNQSWRLQYLTNLTRLPDYESGYGYQYHSGTRGAPVDDQGNPVFHHVPESFQSAASDGERWRWLLIQAGAGGKRFEDKANYILAAFLHQQFGVQTMAAYGRYFPWGRPVQEDGIKKPQSGPYDVHTLTDTETVAKLATGVRRFNLPDEFNYIMLFNELAGRPDGSQRANAIAALARIYENRRRYDKAVTFWQQYEKHNQSHARRQIDQILNNWGVFEPLGTQPAGRMPTVEYRFRNGKRVEFTAYPIKVEKLLRDAKTYIRSNPRRIDRNKINIDRIGWRLVHENETGYLGRKVANWEMELEVDPRHWDRRVTVRMPSAMKQAGAYLLIARMKNGNTARIIIWVSDTVIVKKPLKQQAFYFVADAVNGKPITGVQLEFFGYYQKRIKNTQRYRIRTRSFTHHSDQDGQVILEAGQLSDKYNWLVTATKPDGRFAFLGFSGVWYPDYYDSEYNQTKTLFLTDRPVYRPGHTVKFKAWARHAKYDQEDTSLFAGRHFTVYIQNPKRETVYSQTLTADAYGGFSGQFELPQDASLGVYRLSHNSGTILGGHTFRVEEYKKPEFEVKIEAPAEPVMLGEKIPAVISAQYYFGAPVTEATVTYKVLRSEFDSRWYPVFYWDWFYGPGYWWYGYDYSWYPNWESWGCMRPIWTWWRGWSERHPEIVAEGEANIGRDGRLKIEIDTRLAQLIHGDQDHKYSISAEVRDQSRRTIAGQGEVLVARRPFKVYAWVDRGHYRVGDTVSAGFQARTLDGKPVKGKGVLKLLRITYPNGTPEETEVQKWRLDTDSQGQAKIQIQGSRAGQYRLSYTVADTKNHTIEGGYVFTVRGEGDDGANYRFAKVELIADKSDYAPGDTVRLMINTDKKDAAVVFFVRPVNGVYLPPKVIHMTGKSAIQEIKVTKKDMPNFFVEAFSVYDGKVHSETREIVAPPEQRVLSVTVTPAKKTYRPGEKAKLTLRLTDYFQRPYQGSAVVSVYDRSVEYIAGGSNVPEIREFFWKWRRHHYPSAQSSLSRRFFNLLKEKEISMQPIGVFGQLVEQQQKGEGAVAQEPAEMQTGAEDKAFAEGEAVFEEMAVKRSKPAASLVGRKRADKKKVPAADLVTPVVRSKFADTAFWVANVSADENGYAEVSFSMPENLTAWKIKVWAMGHGTRVGEGSAEAVTRKDVILRLQAPRFFVDKDEVVLSANVHNYLKKKKKVQVQLEFDNQLMALFKNEKSQKTVTIPSLAEKRVDWRVKVLKEGDVTIRMLALTDEESDAMQMRFPVYVHGIAKQVPRSGVLRPQQTEAEVLFSVPAARRVHESRLELRYSPTLAGVMVDALPYLVSYPYGCTEQTLNRFLPTVITQRILLKMGLDLEQIREKRTNLNPQEIGDDRKRARQWQRYTDNPVFDEDTVVDMVKTGINRLAGMQLDDGGWGWFSGYGEKSYPHTTAYVVHGLQIARENQVELPSGMLQRGIQWLKNYQAEEIKQLKRWDRTRKKGKSQADNLDAFVYMVLTDEGLENRAMRKYLYRDRNHLTVYGKAMFAVGLHKVDDHQKLQMVLQNIEQYLVQDDENQTAYLNLPNSRYWWYWYGSEYEAHAYYLKLLAHTAPGGSKAAGLVKYLLNNRKHATYWNSTRDTAIVIEALAEYLVASGEDQPDLAVDIYYDGEKKKTVTLNRQNLFFFDNRFVMQGRAITTGDHTLKLKKSGSGPLYFNAYLDYFTLEDFITREGLEIKVQRSVYRLKSVDKKIKDVGSRGQVVDRKVERYERELLENLAAVKSGEMVEVELIIDSKNDYEYIVIEDMKAAGFEPLEVRSGYTGNEMGAYVEFRDEKTTFFVRRLARGRHSVSYRLRAEVPGRFSALPAKAYAMYAPELRANSDEIKLNILDK